MESLPESPWLRYGLAEGSLLAEKYRLKGVLGEGGMGLVVSACHETLDRMVALKVLRRESANDPVMVERFLREARAAANLRSEHVVHVLDVGTLPTGAPFMVLEYLEGADLAHVLLQQARLPVAVACNYVVQACEAVAEAHAGGIVHRDLKPGNLYLTTSLGGVDCVKVLDFGVSKVLDARAAALTATGMTVGSPVYMAPEQVRGSREVGPRADVWALGVVLYELLTGDLPFEAESLPDLCLAIANETPRPLQSRRADVPGALAAVVARCLEKDPVRRYFDAAELGEALAPFASAVVRSSGSTRSHPAAFDPAAVTLAAPVLPAPSRRPRRLAAYVAAIALAGAAALWLSHRPPAPDASVPSAAGAARSASAFAQPTLDLRPAAPGLASAVPLSSASPSATSPTPSSSSSRPPMPALLQRVPLPGRPERVVAPASPGARTPQDDIPAFR